MTDVGDVVGQATRSAHDWLGQEANNIYKPIGNFIKGVKQGWNGKAQTDTTPQPPAAVARPVQSPDITTRDLPGEPGFYAPNGAYIVNGREIPRIEVTGPYRTHDDSMDEASMMNPEIPSDFGSDSHLRDLLKLSGAYRAGDRSALDKSNRAMLARMTGQDQPTVAPSFGMPGAAHAGQGGSDYQDEEPKGQAHAGQGGYNYGDETEPNDRRMNDADWIMSQNLDEPKGQAHSGQQGYDYQDELDQSDAETSRLNRAGKSVDLGLPPGQLDKSAWDDMMKTVPGLDNDAWNDLVRGKVSEADYAPAQNRAQGFIDPGFNSTNWPGHPSSPRSLARRAKIQADQARGLAPSLPSPAKEPFRVTVRGTGINQGAAETARLARASGAWPQPEPDTDIPEHIRAKTWICIDVVGIRIKL